MYHGVQDIALLENALPVKYVHGIIFQGWSYEETFSNISFFHPHGTVNQIVSHGGSHELCSWLFLNMLEAETSYKIRQIPSCNDLALLCTSSTFCNRKISKNV